jgi:hypothetical protein
MAITQIKGFFGLIGSYDIPSLSSWNKPFGFNEPDNLHPVYSYSLTDVQNSFEKPVVFLRDDPVSGVEKNALLIAEAGNNPDLETIENVYADDWTAFFKICSLIFTNQTTFNTGADNPNYYANRGDEYLASDPVTASIYQLGSFKYSSGKLVTGLIRRTQYCNFIITLGGNLVSVTLYLDPDYLITKASGGNFYVWTYEDSDDTITQDELKEKIVEATLEHLKSGKYKRVDEFKTRFLVEPIVPDGQPPEEPYYIQKQFFIYSNFMPTPVGLVNEETKRDQVKLFLRNKYPGTSGLAWLIIHYPDLFTQSTVNIYPLYNNKVEDGVISMRLHGLSGKYLNEFLALHNLLFNPSLAGGLPYEIIHVGSDNPITGTNPYIFNYPLIAVGDAIDINVDNPISSKFPTYAPIFDHLTIDTEAKQFHLYLIYALNIATGINTLEEILAIAPSSTNFTLTPTVSSEIGYVSFIYKSTLWKIYLA